MGHKKKIIILHSTGGLGHKKAAVALFQAFGRKRDGVEVKNIDVLDYGNPFYKFLYMDFYIFMMTRGKALWGFLYRFTDIPFVDNMMKALREKLDLKNMRGLEEMLIRENPDAIVATHFVLPGIAPVIKKKWKIKPKLYVVITDYGPHGFWISKYADRFFVGASSIIPKVERKGIPPERITALGIPTIEEFSHSFDIPALKAKYGLADDRKTVFMLSGGFGVGPLEAMLEELCEARSKIQVIVVCGHNQEVYDDIAKLREKLNYPVVLIGFTDKVPELMAVSDIMVTKAGGISVTEALNMRLPMILYASIPGQETWNEDLLVENNAAVKASSVKDIPRLVDRMLLDGAFRDSVKAGIDRIRRPNAASDIADFVLKEI